MMNKGVNIWSFPSGMPLGECFALARETGFQGVEVALEEEGELSLAGKKDGLARIRHLARESGIELYSLATALFWKYPLTSGDPGVAEKSMSIARTLLEDAAELGCSCVLAVPGVVDEQTPYDEAYSRALEACQKLAETARETGVCLCLENVWNKFLLSPLEFKSFLDKIGGAGAVGAYFDAGNVRQWGYPEQWVRILGRRIRKVHIKDYRCAAGGEGFVDLLSGDVDFPQVMRALRETGYDDWITAEICPPYRYAPAQTLVSISHAMDYILDL